MSEYTLWSIATTKDPCCQSNLAQCLALPFPATPLPLLSLLMNARQGTHAPLITLSNPSNYQLREEVCGSIGLWVFCFVLSLLPVSLRKGVRGEGREREREGREGGTVVFQRVLRPLWDIAWWKYIHVDKVSTCFVQVLQDELTRRRE